MIHVKTGYTPVAGSYRQSRAWSANFVTLDSSDNESCESTLHMMLELGSPLPIHWEQRQGFTLLFEVVSEGPFLDSIMVDMNEENTEVATQSTDFGTDIDQLSRVGSYPQTTRLPRYGRLKFNEILNPPILGRL